jgi:hypothetical protein
MPFECEDTSHMWQSPLYIWWKHGALADGTIAKHNSILEIKRLLRIHHSKRCTQSAPDVLQTTLLRCPFPTQKKITHIICKQTWKRKESHILFL